MLIAVIALVMGALVLIQNFIYRKRWSRHIDVALSFSAPVACEGDRLELTEIIANRKLLPLPWLAVKFQLSRHLWFDDMENARVSDDFYRNDLFSIRPYRRITRRLPFVCGKRGVYTIKSTELVSGDLFGMVKLALPVPCHARLTVYPKLIDLDEILTSHRQVMGQVLTKRFIQPDPFEFKGIREYQPYDSLRSVNFKATAKTGEWMVNVNGFTVTQETVLILNLAPYSAYPDEALFEHTIRLAASLAVYYAENGVSVGLTTNNDSIESGAGLSHGDNIRELLARIDLARCGEVSCAALLEGERDSYEACKRSGRRKSYVLISTDCKKEIKEGYDALVEAGAEAAWIVPGPV